MSITKVPVNMLSAGGKQGNLEADGIELSVTPKTEVELLDGASHFDNIKGILTLEIPNVGTVKVGGFMTQSDVGEGREGRAGTKGRSGIDGTLGQEGDQGSDGCIGPSGKEGRPGERGPVGNKGEPGSEGPTGAKGDEGEQGRIAVYIQAADPGPVGAGALWIKP